LISKIPQYSIIRRDLVCPNEVKIRVMQDLARKLPLLFEEESEVTMLDGIRIVLEKSWVLIRKSGTEPLIRLTVETESKRKSKSIMERVIELTEDVIKRRLTLKQ
jgi:phosphoglucosamine mutase